MKELNHIDKIVSDSLSGMKVPVDTKWSDMNKMLENLPQAEIPVNNGFLSSVVGKIVAGIGVIGAVVTSVVLINPFAKNTINEEIYKPVDIKIEIVSHRNVFTVESGFDENIIENTEELVNVEENSETEYADTEVVENTQQDTTTTEVTIIHVEQTTIDTIKQK